MERKIRHNLRQINLAYYGIYFATIIVVSAAFIMTFGEIEFPHIAETSTLGTNISTAYIIYLLVSIPFALYGFNKKTKEWRKIEDREKMFHQHRKASYSRILIIGIGLVVGVALVYIMNSRSMVFCAAIAAIALYFSKPTYRKIEKDLDLYEK